MRKLIIIAAVLIMTALGTQNLSSATGDEVKLVKVYSGVQQKYYSYLQRSFTIKVKNIAFEKQVYVHHQDASGAWFDVAAAYESTIPGGYEIWTASINTAAMTGTQFCIKYTVNNATYWDNNNGSNYDVSLNAGAYLAGGCNVLLAYSYIYSSFYGAVDVKNLGYTKDVTIVYTTDGWKNTSTAKAKYIGPVYAWGYASIKSPNEYGFERWEFNITDSSITAVEFAVSYTVNGVTYWDNNFGQNYKVVTTK